MLEVNFKIFPNFQTFDSFTLTKNLVGGKLTKIDTTPSSILGYEQREVHSFIVCQKTRRQVRRYVAAVPIWRAIRRFQDEIVDCVTLRQEIINPHYVMMYSSMYQDEEEDNLAKNGWENRTTPAFLGYFGCF